MNRLPRMASTCVAVSLGAITGMALAQQGTPSTDTPQGTYEGSASQRTARTDQLTNEKFIEKAAQGSLLEMQAARLAQQQSQSAEVRAFSQQMLKDHGLAMAQLKSIAREQGAQIPTQLDSEDQQKLEKLQGQSESGFDAEFARLMNESHDHAVELFEQASNSTSLDQSVRSFASETLPTLQNHQRMARDLRPGETRSAEAPSENETIQR